MRRRILMVSPFAPAGDARHGGARTVRGLASALAERHDLVLLHLEDDERGADAELVARCAAVESVPLPPDGRWSRRLRGGVALASGRSLWAAESNMRALRQRVASLSRAHSAEIVQVEHGILGEALSVVPDARVKVVTLYEPASAGREGVRFRREGHALAHRLDARVSVREERRILSLADGVVVFTGRDRDLLAGAGRPPTDLTVIPLGCDLPPRALNPQGVGPPSLLFVGSFVHPPNIDAATTLATTIFPLVRAANADARLEIVGSFPPPEVHALASESVRVAGDVPSVEPYLDRAAVVVVPIEIGGGMRVKVLEALAAGKAVVATSRAAEGITASAGEELVVVDGHAEIAAEICRLLSDDEARRRLGARARAWALREATWNAMADRYEELYARLTRRLGRDTPS